ncbi:hypothetical protein [Spirosoma sp. KUDC1026]|uniref:hypothetical protein n=1 Tax=Spirosoma sp. KUDC1026 TaxID=2745947 RepID=UPI00159BC521|nr:hypothetical protein [Spirosoma sp. KUDC1026]QKZ13905.1 hypothetical protein HU175_15195 [Spirosoma sp. KUDC1026]
MLKILLGALLISTTSLAQTTKPASKTPLTGSKSTRPVSKAEAKKPIPQTSLNEKMTSKDNAIPSYRMAKERDKDARMGKGRQFEPRRTSSGARKDTMRH